MILFLEIFDMEVLGFRFFIQLFDKRRLDISV